MASNAGSALSRDPNERHDHAVLQRILDDPASRKVDVPLPECIANGPTRAEIDAMNQELASPPRSRFGWPEALIVIATALELAVALLAHHFPYQDPNNHLARYTLISRIWFGQPPGYVVFHWVPDGYIAGDVVGALLVHSIGAVPTLRLIDASCLIALPLGMYALLLRSAPAQRGWALVGVLFGFASYFMVGYLNFALGVGLAFCWLALWYPRRVNATWTARILLAVGAVLLYLVHLAVPLLVLVVIWTDWGIGMIGEDVLRPPPQWKPLNSRLPTILIVTAAVALVWAAASYTSRNDIGPPGEYGFRLPGFKTRMLFDPFWSVSIVATIAMAAGYFSSLFTMSYVRRRSLRVDSLAAAGVVMFVLYMLFPASIPGSGAVDVRWLPAGYLLLFCARQRGPEREPRLALLVPFAACLLHTAIIGVTAHRIDRLLDQYQAALRHVPPNTNLLPLGDGVTKFARTDVMRHFVLWHVIRSHGRAPGLFNYFDAREGDPLNINLAHFVEPVHLYYADSEWGGPKNTPALPWKRIDREYDYIMQLAGGSRVESYLQRHADELWHDDTFHLYKVRKQ